MRCPSCGKTINPDDSSRCGPFCSRRCRLIDLGDWLNERHRIPSDDGPDDLSDIPDFDDDRTH